MDEMSVTVNEAAVRLDVQPRHIRDLIAADRLAAVRHGNVWAVDAHSINDYKRRRRPTPGRNLSPRMAWAALLSNLGTCVDVDVIQRFALHRSEIARLEALTQRDAGDWAWLVDRRATTQRFDTYDKYLDRVAERIGTSRTGVSAAADHNIDIASHQRTLDVYTSTKTASQLKDQLGLEPTATGNLTIRIVDDAHWAHFAGVLVMPRAVVAVDLFGDADTRTASAGHALIESILTNSKASDRSKAFRNDR